MTAHFNQPDEKLSSCAPEDRAEFLDIIEGLKRVLGEDSLRYASFFEAVFFKPSLDQSNSSIAGMHGGCDLGRTVLLRSPETPALAAAAARSWRSDARV
jgi:hypothetical protein